jgi:pentose-5-phosphate-3-epimerase
MEAHLMITDPDFSLDEFVQAGADSFLVHWEGNNNLHRTVQRIRALKPECDLEVRGVDEATAPPVVAAGANVLVAGSSIFRANEGVAAAMETLRAAMTRVAVN